MSSTTDSSLIMDYFKYALVAWDYSLVLWEYAPWIAYSVAFLTLIPKVWRRVRNGAETELKQIKFHRCYGSDRCCHPPEGDEEEEAAAAITTRPRKKVVRRFAYKYEPSEESAKNNSDSTVHSPPPILQTHVNQIAKMFEGNARKVNRVTPIITHESTSDSIHSNESGLKKSPSKVEAFVKREKPPVKHIDDRFFKPSPIIKTPKIPENDENSANLLNSPVDPTPPVTIVQRRQRRYPSVSPSPPSRPNSLKASLENIFALANQCMCSPNGPVTSIEEILSQRRLSRPLSAYSISDLLGDNLPDESYIENIIGNLNT